MPQRSRRFGIFAVQGSLIACSALAAFQLRFGFNIPLNLSGFVLMYMLISLAIKLPIFHYLGLSRGWWRYTSISELITIVKATFASHILIAASLFFFDGPLFPRATMIIDFFLTIVFLGGARLALRLYHEHQNAPKLGRRRSDKQVLILGAGDCGIHLLRQIQTQNENNPVNVVGFIDDSPEKEGMKFLGKPVVGGTKSLVELCSIYKISEVYIAIPSMKKTCMKSIVDLCLQAGVEFKTVPSLQDILQAGAKIHELREVRVEDLLGREPIALNKSKVREQIRDKSVLVTGAGGSIGSELCRQILQLQPRRLILLERSEINLFNIERELRARFPQTQIDTIVADITDETGISEIFTRMKPHIIYHAAAHKHVSLMEASPRDALRNNVIGTWRLAKAAFRFGVESFVMISTDKAVNPLSIMGYSKRMAELAVQHIGQKSKFTKFISVRFGNVLGSSGSVVEIFRKQLKSGEPLTVTDTETTRFFMTGHEAVELVLQAGEQGGNGEICMLDMGKPVRIYDLAQRMIQLADPLGRQDHQIQITGLKPGEKLSEELYWAGEDSAPSETEKLFKLKTKVNCEGLEQSLQWLEQNLEAGTDPIDWALFLRDMVNSYDSKARSGANLRVVASQSSAQVQT